MRMEVDMLGTGENLGGKSRSGLTKVLQNSAEHVMKRSAGSFFRMFHIVASLLKKGSVELWEPSPASQVLQSRLP